MRFAALLLAWLTAAAPAAAQACEASVISKPGEVIAALEGGRTGPVLVMWSVERREGVGEEADHFARPGLMIDFRVGADGALAPERVVVSVTRYSDPELGRAPPLSEVRVRAVPAGSRAIEWGGDDPSKGEAALAKQLKGAWPAELVVEVVARGVVVASSTFDLSVLPVVRGTALQAIAKCRG
ncbi:MAG: hypothetical protein Q8R82_05200 [Hyphomonadaceae bacterium]|nr:hypothetical protein [Hyphomonadaceae bacterium]